MATAIHSAAPSTPASAYPSDEAILGIVDESAAPLRDVASHVDATHDDFTADVPDAHSSFGRLRAPRADATTSVAQGAAGPQRGTDGPEAFPPDHQTQNQSSASRSSTENPQGPRFKDRGALSYNTDASAVPIPEWLEQVSAAAPNAAPELANLWERATALDTFDRAFYGADANAQQQLITQLYSDDPSAFRAMVSSATQLLNDSVAQVSAGSAPHAEPGRPEARPRHTPVPRGTAPPVGAHNPQVPRSENRGDLSYSPDAPRTVFVPPASVPAHLDSDDAGRDAGATQPPAQNFNPAAYAQFEQSTNDAVVSDVSRAIDRAITRALPDGIADGARRRIAGDTLAEVHTALRGDRQLAAQVAAILRGSLVPPASVPAHLNFHDAGRDAGGTQNSPRFDNATRDAIARLISTRARGVVPEAARRVIGEWTGSVLSAHRERSARQQSAGARVDVVGSERQSPQPRRAVKSTDINYRSTSDEDILSW